MSVFGRYRPGFSPRQAILEYGEPTKEIPYENGAEYVEYETGRGRIRMGSEESADGDVGLPLYFYPYDTRPERFLIPGIIRHLRPNADKEVVLLYEEKSDRAFMQVIIEGGRVNRLIWTN